jgi:hypothetical protein
MKTKKAPPVRLLPGAILCGRLFFYSLNASGKRFAQLPKGELRFLIVLSASGESKIGPRQNPAQGLQDDPLCERGKTVYPDASTACTDSPSSWGILRLRAVKQGERPRRRR